MGNWGFFGDCVKIGGWFGFKFNDANDLQFRVSGLCTLYIFFARGVRTIGYFENDEEGEVEGGGKFLGG